MIRTIGIGHQNFEELVTKNLFYIDKTFFIKEWWENNDVEIGRASCRERV